MEENKKSIYVDCSSEKICLYEIYEKLCKEGIIKNNQNKTFHEYSNEYKGLIGKLIEKGLWK